MKDMSGNGRDHAATAIAIKGYGDNSGHSPGKAMTALVGPPAFGTHIGRIDEITRARCKPGAL
jgi:hypothetical protein